MITKKNVVGMDNAKKLLQKRKYYHLYTINFDVVNYISLNLQNVNYACCDCQCIDGL